MIKIITDKDVQGMYLETEYGTFTPIYEYENYDQETGSYIGFKVIKTAEEVYQEWLYNKDKPIETPTDKMEVLEKRVEELEHEKKLLHAQVEALSAEGEFRDELIAEMAMKVYA